MDLLDWFCWICTALLLMTILVSAGVPLLVLLYVLLCERWPWFARAIDQRW